MHRESSHFLRKFRWLRRWFNYAEDVIRALRERHAATVAAATPGRHHRDPHEVQYSKDLVLLNATVVAPPRKRTIGSVLQAVRHTVIATVGKEPARRGPVVGRVTAQSVAMLALVTVMTEWQEAGERLHLARHGTLDYKFTQT